MARPRTVDPLEIVSAIRAGMLSAEAARQFKITRVRVNQILTEHAPDLLPGKLKTVSAEDKKAVSANRKLMIVETKQALAESDTLVDAAVMLGLTTSGLSSRIRRLRITPKLRGGKHPSKPSWAGIRVKQLQES